MWKAFVKYVKEPLERSVSKRQKETLENDVKSRPKCNQGGCIVPIFLRSINRSFCAKHLNESDEERYSAENYKKDTWKGSSKCGYYHSWLEAAGLSGTLAVGWIMSKHFFFKRNEINDHNYQLQLQIYNQYKISRLKKLLLKYVLLAQPVSNENENLPVFESNCAIVNNHVSAHSDVQNLPLYGPQTAEEAINEAAGELLNAHNGAVAEMEYRIGIKFVQHKRYRKAVKHFATASAFRHSDAMFSLAQCYELGLGTRQDFKMAAQLYQDASNLGHETAMYNLGVFYAHGWGGLSPNVSKAQELFEKAAELGQPDAKFALDMRNVKPPSLHNDCDYLQCKCDKLSDNNSIQDSLCETNDIQYIIDSIKKNSLVEDVDDCENRKTTNRVRFDSYSSSSRSSVLSSDIDYQQPSLDNYAGFCYENGFGVKENIKKAIQLYSQSAYYGNSIALYNLASCYESTVPDGDEYQAPLLFSLYKMAAKQGHHYASEKVKSLEIYHTLGILTDYLTADSSHRKHVNPLP